MQAAVIAVDTGFVEHLAEALVGTQLLRGEAAVPCRDRVRHTVNLVPGHAAAFPDDDPLRDAKEPTPVLVQTFTAGNSTAKNLPLPLALAMGLALLAVLLAAAVLWRMTRQARLQRQPDVGLRTPSRAYQRPTSRG